jgi:hypothetical protein
MGAFNVGRGGLRKGPSTHAGMPLSCQRVQACSAAYAAHVCPFTAPPGPACRANVTRASSGDVDNTPLIDKVCRGGVGGRDCLDWFKAAAAVAAACLTDRPPTPPLPRSVAGPDPGHAEGEGRAAGLCFLRRPLHGLQGGAQPRGWLRWGSGSGSWVVRGAQNCRGTRWSP